VSYAGDMTSMAGGSPVPAPYDYLAGGPGYTELERVASDTAKLLLSGQAGYVQLVRSSASDAGMQQPVTANQTIAAIWGGHQASAVVLAQMVVGGLVNEQMALPSRKSAFLLSYDVITEVTNRLYNDGDPAGCQMAFENSVNAWTGLAPVVKAPASPTGWCVRQLYLTGSCEVMAECKVAVDAAGNVRAVPAPPPPASAIVAPETAPTSAPQPPPSHAEVDAAIAAKMKASGESVQQIEKARDQAALASFMTTMQGARQTLMMGLRLPVAATDAQMWAALKLRGIDESEVLDWLSGCNMDLDCFRAHMNLALGDADQASIDKRAKLVILTGAIGAALLAGFVYSRRR